ncbi:MAG: GNAT family N-acetyltransferase [Trueperaceae bacterium]|nr:MAG: GNAT family N-acetyltransferase [Trueperaceae bacterium]
MTETPPSMPTAHLILYVRDQERSRVFYEAALDVAPRLHVPGMTEFELGRGAVLGLMPEDGIRRLLPTLPDPALARGGARAELYLLVAAPRERLARALAAGANELSPVLPRDWGDEAGYCLDPDGHVLAFAAPSRRMAQRVGLRPFEGEHDTASVATWLERADVRRWWGDPSVALADLVQSEGDGAAIVTLDGRAVGVLCWQVPPRSELEDAGLSDLPADLLDVDVLIGDPDARGHGVAPAALERLCEWLRARGVRRVGLAAAVANGAALAAYAKAGFAPYRDFVESGEPYRYFTRTLT